MAVRKLLGTVASSSRSHNQKHRMIQSSENQTNRVGSRMLILLDSVTYNLVKPRLSESEAEAKE